jgi:hypothetical protein
MNLFSSRRVKPLRKVGIVLAAYQPNQQLFEVQLESIRAQDHPDWFCVITMDSPMLTVEEAPWIRQFYEDNRFHFYQNDSQLGVLRNFERGSHIALNLGAEAISFSDQDDFWYANKVTRSLQMLNQQPPLSAVCCDARVKVDGAPDPLPRSHYQGLRGGESYKIKWLFHWGMAGNSMIFDATLARLYPFSASGHIHHDGHIAFVASINGGANAFQEILLDYNIHHSNVSGISKIRKKQAHNKNRNYQLRMFIKKWSGARKMLRGHGSRNIILRFFVSTYVGIIALYLAVLLKEKILCGTQYRRFHKRFKLIASLLTRWIIPRMWIYSLLFSRRRSAPRHRS